MSPPGISVAPEVQAEMVRRYRKGASIREIAETTFWSYTLVRRVLIANGVTPRPRGWAARYARGPQISVDEALRRAQLYGMGLSLNEVAEVCGVTQTAIVNSLERLGVPRRSVSEAHRLAYARGVRVATGACAHSAAETTPRVPKARPVPPRAPQAPETRQGTVSA